MKRRTHDLHADRTLRSRAARLATGGLVALALACSDGEAPVPDAQSLRLPTGALLSPDGSWLFVANSNLDEGVQASTLVALDLRALDRAFADPPRPAGAELSAAEPCRVAEDMSESAGSQGQVVECEVRHFIQREHTVRLPSGAGNIALDLPAGAEGPWRLLVPSSLDPTVTWLDVLHDGAGIDVDCDQDAQGECAAERRLTRRDNDPGGEALPRDPARLTVDSGGFRYAYLPHLLDGALTLIELDAQYGPKITQIRKDFFQPSPANPNFVGGFAVAQRACDVVRPPVVTLGCKRPMLYATHRFSPALKRLAVDPGFDVIADLGSRTLQRVDANAPGAVDPSIVGDRPYMGDLEFEDPATGDRLLIVQTTPPGLLRIDTSLNEDDRTLDAVIDSVALCGNPNVLAVHRPAMGERMAFVSCYSEDQVAAVALGSFGAVATIAVDDGPNELVVDEARRKLYVVHTQASTIGVVELDRTSPRYLQLIRRVGLRAG